MSRAALACYGAVFLGAAVPWLEVAAVVPVGVAAGLHPAAVAVVAFVGNAVTLVGVLALQRQAAGWLRRRRERTATVTASAISASTDTDHDAGAAAPLPDGAAPLGDGTDDARLRSRRGRRARRLLDRWGLPGLAALAPVTVGTHLAAVVLATAGIDARRVAVWMLAGLAVWTVALAAVAAGAVAALGPGA